jgi:hypothetical protein
LRSGWPDLRGAEVTMGDPLAAVPVPDGARAHLRRRMAAPGRHYHGPHHLALGRGSNLPNVGLRPSQWIPFRFERSPL